MNTKASKPLDLPAPVAGYFAVEATDAEATARLFAEDAVVIDEEREHSGRDAIAQWKASASQEHRYTSEPLSAKVSGNTVTVNVRLTGDFPGSPVTVGFRFLLDGEAIRRLEIGL